MHSHEHTAALIAEINRNPEAVKSFSDAVASRDPGAIRQSFLEHCGKHLSDEVQAILDAIR